MWALLRGRVRPRPWPRRHLPTAAEATDGAGPNHYDVLGVSADAPPEAITARFRERAKELHPDAAARRGVPKDVLTRDFQRLQDAYRTLASEALRKDYDATRCSGDDAWRRSMWEDAPWNKRESDLWQAQPEEDVSRHSTAALEKLPLDLLMSGVERDFYAALDHAYHGPQLRIASEFHWPMAFELEVRRRGSDHPHLVEITSGRTLLGFIREAQPKSKPSAAKYSWEARMDAASESAAARRVELELHFAGEVGNEPRPQLQP
mmetsp:Transcript_3298/g.9601  ORF Transcript_3298/g.9601 Transcript_3298/m.9601 type:complete len:263 (-) Transcript_3298:86-874(-)